MRILLVNHEFPPLGGGGGVAAQQLAAELVRRGHAVMVLTSGTSELPLAETVEGIEVWRLPVCGRRSRACSSLTSTAAFLCEVHLRGLDLCRAFAPEVINTWFALPGGPAGEWLARKLQVPNLLTIIGGDIYDPSKLLSPHRWAVLRRAVRHACMRADAVAAISTDVRARARDYYGLERCEIAVIPLGLELPTVSPVSRAALGLGQDEFVVVTIGRLVRRKATERLIEALALLRPRTPRLVVVGDGPRRRYLEGLTYDCGLLDQVTFTGAVSEDRKHALLAAADVFALPSLHEGFGIVFMEAMYAGLPIVARSCGGQRDFLHHGVNALLLDSGEPPEIAAALRTLMDDAALRGSMAEANRRDIGNLTIEAMGAAYEAQLRQVCERARSDLALLGS